MFIFEITSHGLGLSAHWSDAPQLKQRAVLWVGIVLSSVPKSIWNWFSTEGKATIEGWGRSSSFIDEIISSFDICEKRFSARPVVRRIWRTTGERLSNETGCI